MCYSSNKQQCRVSGPSMALVLQVINSFLHPTAYQCLEKALLQLVQRKQPCGRKSSCILLRSVLAFMMKNTVAMIHFYSQASVLEHFRKWTIRVSFSKCNKSDIGYHNLLIHNVPHQSKFVVLHSALPQSNLKLVRSNNIGTYCTFMYPIPSTNIYRLIYAYTTLVHILDAHQQQSPRTSEQTQFQ